MKKILILAILLSLPVAGHATDITWADKTTGGTFTATDANAVKTAVNSKMDNTAAAEGALIAGSAQKATPIDADQVPISDSAASGILKYLTWANVKSVLKTYFDTLYPSGSGTSSGTNTGDNAVNSNYSGLVSNATHTGDATGSTALTVVKINGTSLASLGTGLLKNTTTTGVPSIAINSDLPAMSATVGGAVPTPPNNTTTYLRGDGTFATPGGTGDMVLANVQSVTGLKTFDTTKAAIKGSSTGTTAIASANSSATNYTATLPPKDGTFAMTSDVVAAPTDATITTTDVTTNDASTTKHGWALKATAPASGLINVLGIGNGETVYAMKPMFDATSPTTQAFGDSAAVGTATVAARRDHKHAMPASEVSDTAYDATSWDAVTTIAPSKNAVRDYLESKIGSGADGSYKLTLTNNSAASPTASTDELYFEANVLKANQNGTEYAAALSPTAGQVTFAGPTAARTLTMPDANTSFASYALLAGATYTGKVNTLASASGGAGLNLPHGAAPSAPTDGDLWTTTSGLYGRINGGTVGPFGTGGGGMVYPGAGIPQSTGSAWGTSITAGTGIVTALGVNVGTAGSPVINGGALGTPSSGTLTSCTGLPVAGITASTSTALGIGSVELGHASDTTLARVSAGVISVEGVTVTRTIASGTSALGTGAIASGACATAVTTSATGTATTDVINWGFNGDPTGVTGYAPTANGMLTIIAYPSADNINYKVCNLTAASITPGAITLNWKVNR